MADDVKPVNVPPGDLITALESLTKQTGAELIYQTIQLKGVRTKGVSGKLSAHDAVVKLLQGTPLTVRSDASGAMLISGPTGDETGTLSSSSAASRRDELLRDPPSGNTGPGPTQTVQRSTEFRKTS